MASPLSHESDEVLVGSSEDLWGSSSPWPQDSTGSDAASMHVMNATSAAYHADVAAKHAASLAQWVQYLGGTLVRLQGKVTELEDWKRNALEDVRKL
ncbi:unnamed protein product, partial [Polarella glacialis]